MGDAAIHEKTLAAELNERAVSFAPAGEVYHARFDGREYNTAVAGTRAGRRR